jgi:ribosomal protein S12 methylthiotransferase accessory factor YcaO
VGGKVVSFERFSVKGDTALEVDGYVIHFHSTRDMEQIYEALQDLEQETEFLSQSKAKYEHSAEKLIAELRELLKEVYEADMGDPDCDRYRRVKAELEK